MMPDLSVSGACLELDGSVFGACLKRDLRVMGRAYRAFLERVWAASEESV